MDIVQSFGYLTLGSRLKRLGEALQADTQAIIESFGIGVQPSHYPLLAALDREGPLAIGDLAAAVGISQPGVTRTVRTFVDLDLVEILPLGDDQRRRVVALTTRGRDVVDISKKRIWPRIEAAVQDLCSGLDGPLLRQIAEMERGLNTTSLARRQPGLAEPPQEHVLDRPFWSALMSRQGRLSQGGALARRYAPGLIPFIAIGQDDAANREAVAPLMEPGESLYLVQHAPAPPIPGTEITATARVVQMLCEQAIAPLETAGIAQLTQADSADMLALATLTKPGPFCLRAIELGEFWGIKVDGRLAAMAGTRMVLDGFTELSGVCTHPDFQGRGYGRQLSVFVARRFAERGETPFLHAFDTNARAIALYETIGFRIRTKLNVTVLRRTDDVS